MIIACIRCGRGNNEYTCILCFGRERELAVCSTTLLTFILFGECVVFAMIVECLKNKLVSANVCRIVGPTAITGS